MSGFFLRNNTNSIDIKNEAIQIFLLQKEIIPFIFLQI